MPMIDVYAPADLFPAGRQSPARPGAYIGAASGGGCSNTLARSFGEHRCVHSPA